MVVNWFLGASTGVCGGMEGSSLSLAPALIEFSDFLDYPSDKTTLKSRWTGRDRGHAPSFLIEGGP